MERRLVKFYSKESSMLALHAIPGHFATSNSHINFYIDVTGMKARIQEAEQKSSALFWQKNLKMNALLLRTSTRRFM